MKKVNLGGLRGPMDGCRRYLPLAVSFDTEAHILTTEVDPGWEPQIIEQHQTNLSNVRMRLVHTYGNAEHDRKISNFAELGVAPWSVVDQHNVFMSQIRESYTFGAYYPALVGACALGERLLNELVIRLRASYKDHPATGKVATNTTFSDWILCIEALFAWGVIDDPLATKFNQLRKLRNRSVHYGKHLIDSDARDDSLKAVHLAQTIVEDLFRPHGGPPQFLGGTSGHAFLSLDSEEEPFTREFMLPASVLVSPNFRMVFNHQVGWFEVFDDEGYQDEFPDLTDAEFADHRNNPRRTYPVDE